MACHKQNTKHLVRAMKFINNALNVTNNCKPYALSHLISANNVHVRRYKREPVTKKIENSIENSASGEAVYVYNLESHSVSGQTGCYVSKDFSKGDISDSFSLIQVSV